MNEKLQLYYPKENLHRWKSYKIKKKVKIT